MTMSATFYYRRNIDSVPDTIKRVMHKQAMLDAYPHVFSDADLDEIVDKKMNNGEPYEETLLYLRGARAIHKFLVGGQPRDHIDKLRRIRITRGVALATMRSLAIQMGISLAAQNRRLDSTTIGEMRMHGVPESQEMSFLRLGLDRIIDLIRNTESTNTTN